MKLLFCMIIFFSSPVFACIGGGCARWNCGLQEEMEDYNIVKEIDGETFCCRSTNVEDCKKATCLHIEECSNSSSGRRRR